MYISYKKETAQAVVNREPLLIPKIYHRLALGELQQCAEPDEIYNRPANLFVAGFIGSPKMNMFEGTIHTDGDMYILRSENYELALGQEADKRLRQATLPPDVVLGVRSGDIQLIGNRKKTTLNGHIDLLQPVGPVTYAEVLLEQGVKLIASTTPGEFSVGQKVGVNFIAHKIHYFDQWKGERLPV